MATTFLKDAEDIEAFLTGLTFFGTGGGGDPGRGRKLIETELSSGRKVGWYDPDEVDQDAWCVRVSRTGSTGAPTPAMIELKEKLGMREENQFHYHIAEAVRELETVAGVKIGAIVPPELGASNTCVALTVGAYLGIPVLDADYAGRAIPELCNTTPCLSGWKIWPLATVDAWGNRCVVKEALSPQVAERIVRHLAVASFGHTGVAGFLKKVRDARNVAVLYTLSEALQVGRAMLEARLEGRDVAEVAAASASGWVIFRGEVFKTGGENRDGFFWGEHVIKGEGSWQGRTLRIWYKNENLISWLDDIPYITAPDLISVIDTSNGIPLTNPQVAAGQKVAVVALRARPQYRTPDGLANLGPGHFGFDFEYRPIEEVLNAKGGCHQ
ncbi:DUF917 domain-containing protein [Neomoorella mulderi]|uniref:DUF917 domain-containing protein n=1 Tax=Moorella mulderi DSM 14980 TaxID=1122241 RepID=A0A151AVI8_9FIRM|nr:DUF917 domain-containing protein [Moorella mulderi]KYH31621.1 hypothetical protein MOMUL_21770 [Moorella mulderi DSM 14980]